MERLAGITVALAFLGLYLIIQGASDLGKPAASAAPEEMSLTALLDRVLPRRQDLNRRRVSRTSAYSPD